MQISQAQSRAIAHQKGPMLCLAGPGSGKTLVITKRIEHLIQHLGVNPAQILVVTFSRAAADSMKKRFHSFAGMERQKVTFGTFHSVFYGILRQAYGNGCSRIIDDKMRKECYRNLTRNFKIPETDEEDFFQGLQNEVSKVKTEGINPAHFYSSVCGEEEFRRFYQEYQKILDSQRLMEFDDILLYCRELFQKRPDILTAWRQRFAWILVDEYQDINLIQYELITMLASPANNLFVVGDDDQSIYGFRGAKPELVSQFRKDYPEAKEVLLEENYRCPKTVVETAGNLIRQNKLRTAKQIFSQKKGDTVTIRSFEDRRAEVQFLTDTLRDFHEMGHEWNEMAVLYRTSAGVQYVTELMMSWQIPFQIRDGLMDLYSHWIAKDILAYLRIGEGNRERREFYRIMNRPNRYIARNSVEDTWFSFENLRFFYEDKNWMLDRIDEMEQDCYHLKDLPPFAGIQYIRKAIGYDCYLSEYARERQIQKEELFEILDSLQESTKGFATLEAWEHHIEEYREKMQEMNRINRKEQKGVILSTLHSAKGLEFPLVLILDVNEGTIPHRKAIKDTDLEEERRLLYVGMTRAEEKLYLLWAKTLGNKEKEPSTFLKEL